MYDSLVGCNYKFSLRNVPLKSKQRENWSACIGSMKVLNVAEKPSVAKAVATILSRNQGLRVREGRSRYNKLFEFNYSIRGQHCQMVVTSVIGHLMELEFEDRFRKWHSCDPAHLYHAPVRKFVPEVSFFSLILDFF